MSTKQKQKTAAVAAINRWWDRQRRWGRQIGRVISVLHSHAAARLYYHPGAGPYLNSGMEAGLNPAVFELLHHKGLIERVPKRKYTWQISKRGRAWAKGL